ncbi:unnamed protein product, partial [Polarella glacialis]
MSLYKLDSLLEDAARRSRDVASSGPPPLKEVWGALDGYIWSCLQKRRGLVLPNFCRLGWEGIRCRERSCMYFQLLDSFCRTFGVSNARSKSVPLEVDLSHMEDFNFSKAAIRFSRKLTKDQVHSGLRLLVHQLGDVLGQGRSVSLDFSFGKLLSREREVRFVFFNPSELPSSFVAPTAAAPGERLGGEIPTVLLGGDAFDATLSPPPPTTLPRKRPVVRAHGAAGGGRKKSVRRGKSGAQIQ